MLYRVFGLNDSGRAVDWFGVAMTWDSALEMVRLLREEHRRIVWAEVA